MITIELKTWTAHHNHFLYSLQYYSEYFRLNFNIQLKENLEGNGIIISYNGKKAYLDYSDDFVFLDNPDKYDFYFKRSLQKPDHHHNILPLNFQVNFAYKPFLMFLKMPIDLGFYRKSRIEIIRSLDFLKLTNMSHYSMLLNQFKKNKTQSTGRVIFCTRLWDPDNSIDLIEKERRVRQNHFRINACRIIKDNYNNSFVGVFDSDLSRKLCPELIFKDKTLSKHKYLKELHKSDICIADDGLKDSAGWKIGEYLLLGKAVISTPLNVYVEDFRKNINYLELTDRTAFTELTEKINFLLEDNHYKIMKCKNKEWAENFLYPMSYIGNILMHFK